jgi:hypothetical protein
VNDARVGISNIDWEGCDVKAFESIVEQWKNFQELCTRRCFPREVWKSQLIRAFLEGDMSLFSVV